MNPTLNPMTSSGNLQTPSPFISVVVPVYGCDESLPELYKRLVTTHGSLISKASSSDCTMALLVVM
jgi:hypothetical protein